MSAKAHPIFGNLAIEERATSVVLSLLTDHNGQAVFTYSEIATLADLLARIRKPDVSPPPSRGVFD